MIGSEFIAQSPEERLKELAIQEHCLTHFPEQVFVFESEMVVSAMVESIRAERLTIVNQLDLLENQAS